MAPIQQLADDAPVRRLEYDDRDLLVADVGVGTDASVDVVGETAIVVADGEQYELEVPAGDAQAFIHNGVLTIELHERPEDEP